MNAKSVCIAGASGFLGRNLMQRLQYNGFNVEVITREDFNKDNLDRIVMKCSIVINLVGESIAGIWTKRKKKAIYNSRVIPSRKLVDAINRSGNEVKLIIQVSGVGIYDGRNEHKETSELYDAGFLSRVITAWEAELTSIRKPGIRVIILRIGVVLDQGGGLLKQMSLPLKWGPGFGVMSEDYFPYVQLDDLMDAFLFCIDKAEISGIVNVVAPGLTKINHFFRVLMKIKKKRRILWIKRRCVSLVAGRER